MSVQDPFVNYLISAGFSGLKPAKCHNPPELIRGFKYEAFKLAALRAQFGPPRKHSQDGKFVFVLGKSRAVRIDTVKHTILLGQTPRVVKAFLRSL